MSTSLKLGFYKILDFYIQKNFQVLQKYVSANHQLEGFQFFNLAYTAPGTYTIAHKIGAVPKDIIQTALTGSGTVTWNNAAFTDTTISFTLAGTVSPTVPLTLRFFLGTYVGD